MMSNIGCLNRQASRPSSVVGLFDWLQRNKVQTIIEVTVIDDVESPHKDSSIEDALRGFNVEVWDWKKPDQDPNVISTSSSVVREISLYWTGNNVVLMGWASSQGFANKEKFPCVSEVIWHITVTSTNTIAEQLRIVNVFLQEVRAK
jgi:hypothetical protein